MEYNKDYGAPALIIAKTIGNIRTNFDIISVIAVEQKEANSFWDIVYKALYDKIVLESFKLVDKKNLSVFSLIKLAKNEKLDNEQINELESDYSKLYQWISKPKFTLIKFRHTRLAHHPKSLKYNDSLPVYADLHEIMTLLTKCETLIKKYNLWIQGPTYNINFNSIYAGGHKDLLSYVAHIIC